MKYNYLKYFLIFYLILIITGCAGWRQTRTPEMPETPDQFINAGSIGGYIDDPWWENFSNPVLTGYIEQALDENLTIRQTAARLDQFRAIYGISRASWFPILSANGNVSETGPVGDPDPAPMVVTSPTKPQYGASLTAAYELDIWGKLKAGRDASYADYLATAEDFQALAITISANIARTYYSIITLKLQLELLNQTVESYQANFQLVSERYKLGLVTTLDVYQAKTTLEGALAQKSIVEENFAKANHGLSILLGEYPGINNLPDQLSLPVNVEIPPPGIPSDLIQRRPDLRSAYYRLKAADKRAAEAVAERFPSFSLTGTVSSSSEDLEELIDPDNMFWNAIGNITMPLFQGGRLKANAEQAEAAWKAEIANYKQILLNAFMEVENALLSGEKQFEYVSHLEKQTESAGSALRLSTDQYLRGVTSYLPVVVAQTFYLTANSNLITARLGLVEARINLVTALGGDWTKEYAENFQESK